MKKLICSIGLLITLNTIVYAQSSWRGVNERLSYGVKVGVTWSSISNLETTILSEPYFLNYTLTSQPRYGYTAGVFLNYKSEGEEIAIQTEIMYAQQGSNLLFNNFEKDFNYKMQFQYQYFNIVGMLKIYPLAIAKWVYGWEKLSLGVGPQLGFNISPQNIVYTSGGTGRLDAFGSDLQQQQQLRNVLKGKNNLGLNFDLGYEFNNFGFTLDARYHIGLTDLVETQANSYNFIENKNTNTTIQFTIGWNFNHSIQ